MPSDGAWTCSKCTGSDGTAFRNRGTTTCRKCKRHKGQCHGGAVPQPTPSQSVRSKSDNAWDQRVNACTVSEQKELKNVKAELKTVKAKLKEKDAADARPTAAPQDDPDDMDTDEAAARGKLAKDIAYG